MYEKLAELIDVLVDRWTSKSPKAGIYVTNTAVIVGIVATLVTIAPVAVPALIFPPWVIPLASALIAVTAKLSKE